MSFDKAVLALADGTIFLGKSIGYHGETNGEIVFNTSMTGYQEILTDPSYASQIVTLTYPHIGNTGINSQDVESNKVWTSGLVIKNLPIYASNWRKENNLTEYLISNKTVAISDIDTRKLTSIIRNRGAQSAAIMAGKNVSEENTISLAKKFSGLSGLDLAKEVTTEKSYKWEEGEWRKKKSKKKFKVVALDFGIKKNILRILCQKGCEVTVLPAKTTYQEINKFDPDGVFLSNGPGDPEPCQYAIKTIKELIEKSIPIFGICLGMHLFAKHSEEGNYEGLGWIDGKVKKFNFENTSELKIPHVGWNSIHVIKQDLILQNINDKQFFYFTHSYHLNCDNDMILTKTNYGYEFPSLIKKDNIIGSQFHPEKSGSRGLNLLQNFFS